MGDCIVKKEHALPRKSTARRFSELFCFGNQAEYEEAGEGLLIGQRRKKRYVGTALWPEHSIYSLRKIINLHLTQ